MPIEQMRIDGEAVYEVVDNGPCKRCWQRVLRIGPHGDCMVEVTSMYAEG